MMIALISPPKLSSHSSDFFVGRSGIPPINLAYLASALKQKDLPFVVVDALAEQTFFTTPEMGIKCEGKTFDKILDEIPSEVTIVGVSSMFTTEFNIVRELCAFIKRERPSVIIALGGEHASSMAVPILKYEPAVDFIFYGESESSLVLFMENHVNGQTLENSPGIYFRREGKIIKNDPCPRMIELDDLFPSWSSLPIESYLARKVSTTKLGARSLPIISTRGCPYKCTFCSAATMWGSRYVMRSIDSIVAEIDNGIKNYGVEHFEFQDLSTSINRKWFKSLLEALISQFPGISWEMSVGTRSEILDREILQLLKDSGTTKITYAPETGSESLSKKIKKRLNYKKMFGSIKTALSLNMEVKASTIIGFPEESPLDLLKTLFMVLKLGWFGVKNVTVFVFTAYPGSELFNREYVVDEISLEVYEGIMNYQSENSPGGRVFNPALLVKYPREQVYTFIANSMMVFAYTVSILRRPYNLSTVVKNVYKGNPQGPIEIGLFYFLKKINLKRFFRYS